MSDEPWTSNTYINTIVRSKPVLSFFGLFFSLHILVLLLFLAELLVMAVASETFHHPHQPWVCWQRMLLARLLISLGGLQQPRMWCQLPPMPFKSLCPLLPWIDEKTYSHTVNSLHEKKKITLIYGGSGRFMKDESEFEMDSTYFFRPQSRWMCSSIYL